MDVQEGEPRPSRRGRSRFLGVFANIESGEECERFAPTLLALAEGAAASADVIELRPHLRHCAACRASIRELHSSRRHRLALHLPLLAGVAPLRWLGERIPDAPAPRLLLQSILQRVPGPDVTTGVQLASSGAGRDPAVATLLGLCLGAIHTDCLSHIQNRHGRHRGVGGDARGTARNRSNRFRARPIRQAAYPYASGVSRIVTVSIVR